jgi:hypothetical protein
MKKLKLKLDVDTLRVDSFGTVPSAAARNGVRAHEETLRTKCGGTCADSQCTGPCWCVPQPGW